MAREIIDRRLAGRNKSIGNRERFLRRYKEQIRDAVRRAINERVIRDIERAEDIAIPRKDISEPQFQHGQGGARDIVHPGNTEYLRGDRIARPYNGPVRGGSEASDSGSGEDVFAFTLTKEEFMQLFFEDLALPHLLRTHIGDNPQWQSYRAGFTQNGTPNSLSVIRSMRGALGRRIAVGRGARLALEEARTRLRALEQPDGVGQQDPALVLALQEEIRRQKERLHRIPYLDPMDMRFRNRVRVPVPTSKAVMFCLMDVSGSMDQLRKDLAKRFFILLYLFLTRQYDKTDIVFIRHHTQAQEVDEESFFHSTETGGTVVSSALVLMKQIILDRYPSSEWNIYGAQASDGDNFSNDSSRCRDLLADSILPLVRYFAYVQVVEFEQNLWTEYQSLAAEHPNFALRKATSADQIYPVFRNLFRKQGVSSWD